MSDAGRVCAQNSIGSEMACENLGIYAMSRALDIWIKAFYPVLYEESLSTPLDLVCRGGRWIATLRNAYLMISVAR
jgi:hypothetical protein